MKEQCFYEEKYVQIGFLVTFCGEGLAAAASIPGNLVQAGVGIVTAYIFSLVIDKIHIVDLIKE